MLGLVRLIDDLDEKTAQFAILVRSQLKGHGLGWLLMRRVIDYAKQKGLRRVSGDVLAENTTMLQMCAELGFHAEAIGSDIKRVVLDLENIGVQCTQPLGAVRKAWPYTRSCPSCLTKNKSAGCATEF